jgi:hypothetical protein
MLPTTQRALRQTCYLKDRSNMSDESASIQGKILKIVEELQRKVQVNENRILV